MATKNIKEFALIGFVLLAVLFGMQIMVFVFGAFGSADLLEDTSVTVTNESGAYVNITGYTVSGASVTGFTGASATAVWVNVSGTAWLLQTGNYSLSSAGVLTNVTIPWNSTQFDDANISYTYTHKTEAEIVSDETTNKSLRAVGEYAGQSGTQFTTLGIAITLVILIMVFMFFWKAFMGKGKGESGAGSFG